MGDRIETNPEICHGQPMVRQLVKASPKASGEQLSLFKELDDWKGYCVSVMITNDEE